MEDVVSEYRIEQLADFANVPEDRLMACLEEFANWVDVMRVICKGEPLPDFLKVRFTWVDDGKRDLTLSVTLPHSVREEPNGKD